MTERNCLLQLLSWLSPVFPTGGFAYSSGLEQAVAIGHVRDRQTLADWLEALLQHGSAHNDAVLFAASWRAAAEPDMVHELCRLGEALAGSAERHRETMDQGAAFLSAAQPWFAQPLISAAPLPVATGTTCAHGGVPLVDGLSAFLHAFLSNQLQAAIRLSVIGQHGAVALLAALEPAIVAAGIRADNSTLDDLGSCAIMADIAAMNHETQATRLFLS
jgi:urease accessory protein